jgi:hypothetical protein
MNAQVIPITSKAEAAWNDYVEATRKAQSTLALDDGIAAGKAYRRFLELFLTDEQRQKIGAVR